MHKNRRLFELATCNSQRQALDAFIAGHPQFQGLFASAKLVFHPELSVRLGPVVHRASERMDEISSESIGAHTLKTSSVEKALSSVETWTGRLPAGHYIVVLGESNGIRFDGELYWVPEMPGIQLSLPEQLPELLRLVAISKAACMVSAIDGDAVVYSEAVSEWLSDEQSPGETEFELLCWGLDGHAG